jgi:hypothetical protein
VTFSLFFLLVYYMRSEHGAWSCLSMFAWLERTGIWNSEYRQLRNTTPYWVIRISGTYLISVSTTGA